VHWQDVVLAGATAAFIIALMPTVLSRTDKPALPTSVLTTVILFVVTVAYVTLGLWLTSAFTAFEGVLWAVITLQTLRLRRRDTSDLPSSPAGGS